MVSAFSSFAALYLKYDKNDFKLKNKLLQTFICYENHNIIREVELK